MKKERIQTNWSAAYIRWFGFMISLMLLFDYTTAEADKLYWTDNKGIHRVDLDGGNMETPVPVLLRSPIGIAVDEREGKIYWADSRTRKVQRANLDGTNIEDIIAAKSGLPYYVVVDTSGGKLYWTDTHIIQRSNLDGTEVEEIVTWQDRVQWPRGIAVDSNGRKIYWADSDTRKIQRSNLDGTAIEDLVTEGLRNPLKVAVDPIAGKIYWTDIGTIFRSDLDGKNVEETVVGLDFPSAIVVDSVAEKLYWTEWKTGKIHRSNLDGTHIEEVFTTGVKRILGIAIDMDRQKIYWTDYKFPPKIQRANLDGTDIEMVITTELSPMGIALDTSEQKIYWTNPEAGKVQRSNFNGSNIEDLVIDGLCWSSGIDLDTDGGKMYWADGCAGVHRSNLDGTDVEILVAREIAHPNDVAVDVNNGKIYWTNGQAETIQRANLDGTDVEDVVESRRVPRGIALDVKQGKIYSTEIDFTTGAGIIRRLNFDGTKPQTALKPANIDLRKTRLSSPLGIVVDPYGGKVYWTDLNPGRIHRANLNGTGAEDFVTGVNGGRFIALDLTQTIDALSVVNHQGKQPALWGRIRGNALLPNFPNPFNPETWLPYQLTETAHVQIHIYDVAGHLVRTLDLGTKLATRYLSREQAAYWDGRNDMGEEVSSGVYFYTLEAGDYQRTRRMTVVR